MLKRKEPIEHNQLLLHGVDAMRKMLMNRGYFVREVISVSDDEVDILAIREGLLDSERMLMRIVLPDVKGGLGVNIVKRFFNGQKKVFNLKCVLVSLSFITSQAKKYIRKSEYSVYDLKWLEENTDFLFMCDKNGA